MESAFGLFRPLFRFDRLLFDLVDLALRALLFERGSGRSVQ
jgi:hypothetical protein